MAEIQRCGRYKRSIVAERTGDRDCLRQKMARIRSDRVDRLQSAWLRRCANRFSWSSRDRKIRAMRIESLSTDRSSSVANLSSSRQCDTFARVRCAGSEYFFRNGLHCSPATAFPRISANSFEYRLRIDPWDCAKNHRARGRTFSWNRANSNSGWKSHSSMNISVASGSCRRGLRSRLTRTLHQRCMDAPISIFFFLSSRETVFSESARVH